jgi:hypothetical protein
LLIGKTASAAAGCVVEYDRSADTFRLGSEDGAGWLGPIPTGGQVVNSRCELMSTGSSAVLTDTGLAVTVALGFPGALTGFNGVFLLATDDAGASSGWESKGTWIVPAGSFQPSVRSLLPASGAESSGSLAATFTRTGGASQHYLGYILLLPTPNVAPD